MEFEELFRKVERRQWKVILYRDLCAVDKCYPHAVVTTPVALLEGNLMLISWAGDW